MANPCNRYGVQVSYTTSYPPRADPTERVNKVVKTLISGYVIENLQVWDKNLAAISLAIRTARHSGRT